MATKNFARKFCYFAMLKDSYKGDITLNNVQKENLFKFDFFFNITFFQLHSFSL